jgi:hypothetical protein
MEQSHAVGDGLRAFYERFSRHDPDGFAEIISTDPGVSVIGSGPGEGHDDRDSWIGAYRDSIAQAGLRLESGPNLRGWQEGSVGFARDDPRFMLPDGSYLPTRLTGVLHLQDGQWKVVHLHFSVGVPDEQAIQPPPGGQR